MTTHAQGDAHEPATLECTHCGAVAIESDDGLFTDGDGGACISCGHPGHVTCDCETPAEWACSDANDAVCTDPTCEECVEIRAMFGLAPALAGEGESR